MMLVSDNEMIDSIGGGEIENEVIQYAKTITVIKIKTFHLDNQAGVHLGMICGNENTIIFITI